MTPCQDQNRVYLVVFYCNLRHAHKHIPMCFGTIQDPEGFEDGVNGVGVFEGADGVVGAAGLVDGVTGLFNGVVDRA